MSTRWGIDLGGTKIEGAVLKDGAVLNSCRYRIPTEASGGYEHIISQIEAVVVELEGRSGLTRPDSIGIGTPGVSDPSTGLIRNSNTLCLNGRPVKADLASKLGLVIHISNDANCFALAEAILGAGKGAEVVFGVILGTGVGGGIVVNGRVLTGSQGIAGEWGHNVLDPLGERCFCGKYGCNETVLCGPAVERWHVAQGGEPLGLKEIDRLSSEGDAACRATIEHLCERFGCALSAVVNLLDPHVVVLGGGVGQVKALYTQGVNHLANWALTPDLKTRVVPPELGDSAGVFGAALLVP